MDTKKIAVLCGGRSLERDVSLRSGERVYQALIDRGFAAFKVDLDEQLVTMLRKEQPDLVYITLHGKLGEDGTVQELLEIMGIPYTGPGVLASRISFDKAIAKEFFMRSAVPTPAFVSLDAASFKEMGAAELLPDIAHRLGLPLIVKPAGQGSALGIKVAHREEEMPKAIIAALSYDQKVVVESFIHGREVSVSLVGEELLPIVEVSHGREFFDFEAMYTMGATEYFVPARLEETVAERVRTVARAATDALGVGGVARVDLIVEEGSDEPYVLEVNSSPGMTETSLLPLAAEAAGLSMPALVDRVVQTVLAR